MRACSCCRQRRDKTRGAGTTASTIWWLIPTKSLARLGTPNRAWRAPSAITPTQAEAGALGQLKALVPPGGGLVPPRLLPTSLLLSPSRNSLLHLESLLDALSAPAGPSFLCFPCSSADVRRRASAVFSTWPRSTVPSLHPTLDRRRASTT